VAGVTDALWYFGRGTGVTVLVLLSLVVVLGIVTRSGQPLPGLPRFAVAALHRAVSLAALAFLTLHVLTLLLDPYAQLRLEDVVLPFRAAYRPAWQGLGTVALDLVVLLVASSLLRQRIGVRAWRWLHWAAYLCWPAAVAHAIGTGTDRHSGWLLTVVVACAGAVGAAGIWRLVGRSFEPDIPVARVPPPTGLAGLW
jgi:sulfoxide reductase heme-binding subunit YedZ